MSIRPILLKYLNANNGFNSRDFKKILSDNYPLFSVLVAFIIVALSLGPYCNSDTSWEYEAVSGIIKWGLPYANGFYLIDQPPVGFYIHAFFFSAFGFSINEGTFLVTLFGLGCIVLLYTIGKLFYNEKTGFFAAILFAFSPWHLILSRSFLIDTQCLFFSLFSLLMGILAIRRASFKFFVVSGILFSIAFTTKLYAVFVLIPLMMLYLYYRPKKMKNIFKWWLAFALPVVIISFLWYGVVTGQGMSSIVYHMDFKINNPSDVIPSYSFVVNFLVNYGLGWFFIDAALFSFLLCFVYRRILRRFLIFDLICVAVIICAILINTYLGVVLNLKAPYLNAIKYEYQALPFFTLLVASLISKSTRLFDLVKTKIKLSKVTLYFFVFVGLFLLISSMLYNMRYVNLFSTSDFLIFRVDPTVDLGYSLFNSAPIEANSIQMVFQYFGFVLGVSGLLWISRHLFLHVFYKVLPKKN